MTPDQQTISEILYLQDHATKIRLLRSTAKQECIDLLNWMFAGAAETIPYPGPNMWLRDLSDEYKDSAALYEAFKNDPINK